MEGRDLTLLGQAELLQLALEAGVAGDDAATIAWLREATARSDASGAAHYLLGAEYAQAGLLPEATAQMERALAHDPSLSVARIQLALLLIGQGDLERAREVLVPLSGADQLEWLRHFGRGLTLLSEDRLPEAAAALRAGVEGNAVNPPLNDDMRKLLAQIAATPEPAPEAKLQANDVQDDEVSHVLLSAYTGNARFDGH